MDFGFGSKGIDRSISRVRSDMESYLNENFGDVKAKNSSEEALQRWRKLCWLVKNRKRRFRFTANLTKRNEAEAIRRSNQVLSLNTTTNFLDSFVFRLVPEKII